MPRVGNWDGPFGKKVEADYDTPISPRHRERFCQGAQVTKILHIITGLNLGGAEMMLFKLVGETYHDEGLELEVISLLEPGPIGQRIADLGIKVSSPGMNGSITSFVRFPKLVRMVRDARPDLVQTWMSHANLIGGIAARLARCGPVIWGLRQSHFTPGMGKFLTRVIILVGAWLSRTIPARIVCVSEAARQAHTRIGYDEMRCLVIQNGFDLDKFRPDSEARIKFRSEIGVDPAVLLIGHVARYDPYKDHSTFLAAAATVRAWYPETVFVLVGGGISRDNPELAAAIDANGLGDAVHLLGPRSDIPYVTAALDIAVSSSVCGEAFSNTLGEALCCGVCVATTDVGDSAAIVREAGRIVAPGDPKALANAIENLIALGSVERTRLGLRGRERMEREFGIPAIAAQYRALYDYVLLGSVKK